MNTQPMQHPYPTAFKFTFSVGKPLPKSRRGQAVSSLSFLPEGRRLEILIPSPAPRELQQFCEGTLHMALAHRGSAFVLLHRFGDLPWQTAFFDGNKLGQEKHRLYKALARERKVPFEFSVAVIDRDTQAVRALRPATLSPLFASMIGKAMKATDSRTKDTASQIADLDWLMTQHPGDLLGLASLYERAIALPACG